MTSSLRPQLWTFLGVALLCRALVTDQGRFLWLFPALFALWANMHGGWIVGLGILGVWGAADTLAVPSRARRWGPLVFACAFATIVTPYGWRLWEFLWQTVGLGRVDIDEWGSLWGTPALNWVPWFAGVAGAFWVFRWRGPRAWSTGLVLAMLAIRVGARHAHRVVIRRRGRACCWRPPFGPLGRRRRLTCPGRRSPYEPLVALALFIVLAGAAIGLGRRTMSLRARCWLDGHLTSPPWRP